MSPLPSIVESNPSVLPGEIGTRQSYNPMTVVDKGTSS